MKEHTPGWTRRSSDSAQITARLRDRRLAFRRAVGCLQDVIACGHLNGESRYTKGLRHMPNYVDLGALRTVESDQLA